MTVRDILKLVCEFVGERELAQKLATRQQLQEREQQKIEIMTNCFNLVNQEIASDYLPFLHKEEVDIEDGVLNFSSLKNKVINIYEIKNRFGFNLKFRNYPNFVEVFGKGKWVTYSFLPADKALDDEVEMFCGLSARVYAYGVVSEFLLVDGVSEDAEIWEERFKESLFVLSRKRGEHKLPARSWF